MAKCPYFEDKGGWLTIEPYCKLVCNKVPEQKYKHYCDTYDYTQCDYYKEKR